MHSLRRGTATRVAAAMALSAVVLVGCSGGKNGGNEAGDTSAATGGASAGVSVGAGGPDELFAETASFEVLANKPQRIMVGVSTKDQRILAGGAVTLRFTSADDAKTIEANASYLSVPGMPAVAGEARIGRPSTGTGVYAAEVTFPKAGVWEYTISPVGALEANVSNAAVDVMAEPRVPSVGEAAPLTKNLTLATPDVQQEWLDSTASADAPADPLLHSTVIADAIAAKRPVVIVVSTPAFCVSRFCGPVTELVRTRAERDKNTDIAYVHLEVWRDFENRVVNKGAAEWILPRDAEGREPWIFVVDRGGKVAARFDNVIDEAALDQAIRDAAA